VVDAGIDSSHPDLAGQLWVNPGEIPDNGLDDDRNGHVDDIHGWNMVDNNADLSDSTGHGTAMAGIIAAARNDQGITGVCPDCRLMVVKVTGDDGLARYPLIAAGIAYAAQNGADVINISLRGRVNSSALWKAVAKASQRAVVASGAGNDGGTAPVYPGAYDRVLAVAATAQNDTKLESSNHGDWVDVAAPGSEIRTCRNGGGYWSKSGTSVAAAVASGLAGLLRCQHPDWSPEQVHAQIVQTADCVDSMNPRYKHQLGSGRINADRASSTGVDTQPVHACCGVLEQPSSLLEIGRPFELELIL
jgi:subtilisin family serine protease